MKKIILTMALAAGLTASAQVKVGTNPTTLATDANFQVEGTTTAEQFIVLKNGNVGIGTSTPSNMLEVRRDDDLYQTIIKVRNSSTAAGARVGISFGAEDSNSSFMNMYRQGNSADINFDAAQGNGAIRFLDAGVETMRITDNGNVGIGTSTPSEKLSVAGHIVIPNANWYKGQTISLLQENTFGYGGYYATRIGDGKSISLGVDLSTIPGNQFHGTNEMIMSNIYYFTQVDAAGTNFMARQYTFNNGKFGIGSNVVPSASLHVVGDARITVMPAGAASDDIVTVNAAGELNRRTLAAVAGAGADGDAWAVTGEDQTTDIGRIGSVAVGSGPSTQAKLMVNGGLGYSANNTDLLTNSSFAIRPHTSDSTILRFGYAAASGGMILQNSNGPGTAQYPILLNPFGSNVGVGTDNPTEKFEVQGGNISIKPVASVNASIAWKASDNSVRQSIVASPETAGGPTDKLEINNTYGYTAFLNNGSERMRIIANGNVGIGTTAPSEPLTITKLNGATGATSILLKSNGGATGDLLGELRFGNVGNTSINASIGALRGTTVFGDGSLVFKTSPDDLGPQTRMIITQTGNVGIGTTTPSSRLHVNTVTNGVIATFRQTGGANNPGVFISTSESPSLGIIDFSGSTTADGVFRTSNVERMRILGSNGNVGIGTATPGTTLHVTKNNSVIPTIASFGNTNRDRLLNIYTDITGADNFNGINSSDTAGTIATAMVFSNGANVERMRITQTGNVGIGTTTPTSKLHVVGLPVFVDDAAAGAAGLTAGAFWVDGMGIVHSKL